MSAFKAYIEGYEACLRRFYESKDWKLITREISEPRSPYSEDAELYHAWLKGWKDAAGESYVPTAFRGAAHAPSTSSVVVPPPVGMRATSER